jgi:hypothetical protein
VTFFQPHQNRHAFLESRRISNHAVVPIDRMNLERATVAKIGAIAVVLVIVILGIVLLYWQSNQIHTGSTAECVLARYVVFFGYTSTTSGQTFNGQSFITYTETTSFVTTLTISEPAGYVTSTSVQFTGTMTGAINSWNSTVCTAK